MKLTKRVTSAVKEELHLRHQDAENYKSKKYKSENFGKGGGTLGYEIVLFALTLYGETLRDTLQEDDIKLWSFMAG